MERYNYNSAAGGYREQPRAERRTEGEPERPLKRRRWYTNLFITAAPDPVLLITIILLVVVGLIMMFSAGYTASYYKNGSSMYYFQHQSVIALGGIVVMILASFFNYRKLNGKLAVILYGFSLALLAFTFIRNYNMNNDFKRWISIAGVRFQPSEIAKFTLIVMLAYLMSKNYDVIRSNKAPRGKTLNVLDDVLISRVRRKFIRNANANSLALTAYYALIISAVCLLVFMENHISCTILIFLLGVCMMWVGGVKKGYFAVLFIIVAAVVTLVILKPDILPEYAQPRIIGWLDKTYDPQDTRWQTNQSLYAIASGGPFGLGLGGSIQKQMYVSEPQNDFIFAIICEELGFFGAASIICLFGFFAWRTFYIAINAKDTFGTLLAIGIGLQVSLQVILNIAVVTDMLPNTGIALPFFSYGGTSLLILLAEMGVLLSVSRMSSIEKT